MKKIFAVILCLTVVLSLFAACGKKSEEVKAVEALIDALDGGSESLDAVYDAYLHLPEEDRALVKNADKLLEAKKKADDLKKLEDDVKEAAENIRAQKNAGRQQYTENIGAISALLERYEALSDEEKAAFPTEELDVLKAVLPEMTGTQTDAEKAAAQYVKAFKNTHPGETVLSVYCIGKRNAAGDFYYVFALEAGEKDAPKAYYATATSSPEMTAETYENQADLFFADTPLSTHNAVADGNIQIDLAKLEAQG